MIKTTSTDPIVTTSARRFFPVLCWKAILGGTVAAIGIHILLTSLGVGAGLAVFTPATDTDPVSHFSVGAAVIWSVCALVALLFGGLIAGRFSQSVHSGFVHGLLVWSLTLIISAVLLASGGGLVFGGAAKILGGGLALGGVAASNASQDGVKRTTDQLSSFVDEAVLSIPTNSLPKASIRAKREVGFAVAKLFAPGNDVTLQESQTAVVNTLVEYTQMSQADAQKTVSDWVTSYQSLKQELTRLADQAARDASCISIWSFFALLIGLLVTSLAGSCGAKRAVHHAELELVPPTL